jgi:NAD(P)-dependent dehydrogenase (short-subunit alcohol dehydrogenase family)
VGEQLRIFNGGVAVVTGAASGIGRALTEELAARGCHVVAAHLEFDAVSEQADSLNRQSLRVTPAHLDVADEPAVTALVERAVTEHGRLDYIFNNAGIGAAGSAYDHTLDAWNRVIDVNLRGVLYGIRAAYPIMREQGFGHIVNTASMAGLMAFAGASSYAMTKHAVVGLSRSLRAEAAADGIRVSVFCPGVIRTAIIEGGKHGILLESDDTRGLSEGDIRGVMRSEFEKTRPMDPNAFAKKALDDVAANRAIIVHPRWWKVFWWLDRLSPRIGEFLARYGFGRMSTVLTSERDRRS